MDATETTAPRAATPAGKRLEWALVAVAIVGAVCACLLFRGRMASAGSVRTIDITVVSGDRRALSCAFPSDVKGLRCAFANPTKPTDVQEGKRLAPYLTTDRTMYLVAGLFVEPHVEARFNQDATVTPGRRRRFTTRCEVELVEHLAHFGTRFDPRGRWEKSGPAWVVTPKSCRILP